jgi:ABC-2 type transport system permease protein
VIALVRTEFTKATRRIRTLVISALLIGLPTLIVVAIHARGNRNDGDNAEGLFRLAQQSGLLVPAAVLSAMSGFLLVVVAGTLAGDSVASDAAWGNLRYLLMRPVPRDRLVVAKAFVAGVLIWACTLLVTVAALVAGVILFGSHTVTVPAPSALGGFVGGFQLDTTTLLVRVLVATAYVAFGFTALLAIGTLFSTLTDSATGAVGATIGAYIVFEILDGIPQLGSVRYLFPTHYLTAWQSMFTQDRYSQDMLAGIIVQLAYLVVFGTAAVLWFRTKDIRS